MARRERSVPLPLLLLLLLLSLTALLANAGVVTGKQPAPRVSRRVDVDAEHQPALNHDLGAQRGENKEVEGRTFGHKRIQFMMMPMIYKMGVMMTMLAVLTVISLKGLMVGVALLVLKLSTLFGKFFAGVHGHSSSSWNPQQQPIHLHLHSGGPYGDGHGQTYSGWETGPGSTHENYYYKG